MKMIERETGFGENNIILSKETTRNDHDFPQRRGLNRICSPSKN